MLPHHSVDPQRAYSHLRHVIAAMGGYQEWQDENGMADDGDDLPEDDDDRKDWQGAEEAPQSRHQDAWHSGAGARDSSR